MSYSDKLKQSQQKAYNAQTATKILKDLDDLRMGENKASERRWVWELLQNAKDVGFDENPVSIEVNFDKSNSFVEFKHNGKPFSVDNITFLIEQVSTKERKLKEGEKPKTTGKFGTGFLTTHLLSEIVELKSIVKEPELPYRKFSILLDRSGRELDEITESVNSSIAILEELDSYPAYENFNPNDFNTVFKYNLEEYGLSVAEVGISDLQIALPFTLAFLPNIQSVSILSENITYELESIEELTEEIKLVKISKKKNDSKSIIEIVVLGDEDVNISIEIERKDDKIFIKKFDEKVPRLFCDFPLIGTEDFHFPVIVNSSMFNPNEPRNGIYLTDKHEQKIDDNKDLMKKALSLFFTLLDFASESNWQNMFHLAAIKNSSEKNWLSKNWFETEILKPARTKILSIPIVDTEKGDRISITDAENKHNVYFPHHKKNEVREKIWDLEFYLFPNNLPAKKDIHNWHEVVWSDCYKDTIEELTKYVAERKHITDLAEKLAKDEDETLVWLNNYFDLLNYEGAFISEIINDKYSVIPNQNGVFKKRTDLSIDTEIEEELKNVLQILAQDVRGYLRHKKIITKNSYKEEIEGVITYQSKTQENIIDDINKILKEGKNDKISDACDYLTTCFSEDQFFPEKRQKIYQFSKDIWKDGISEKKSIHSWSENIWTEVDKLQIKWLVQTIAEAKNIDSVSTILEFNDVAKSIKWLDTFVTFIVAEDYDSQLNLKTAPILPTQNGNFKVKDDLFLDDGEIDEAIKDIAESLGYECREELLDIGIYLELPPNRVRNQKQIADEIRERIKPLFSQVPREPETKKVFKELYLWFNKNKGIAEDIFEDLYKSKHKLRDDDEVAEDMYKASQFDELLNEFGVTNYTELRKLLRSGLGNSFEKVETPKPNIASEEFLLRFGITSQEELLEALKDKNIAQNFVHRSNPSIEMFEYVMRTIERAKNRVREYLETQPDYDCSDWTETSKTIISGVNKFERPIIIVIRPSDRGQVIFYYSDEKNTLKKTNSELWIDNGVIQPEHLTLGQILDKNRIERIDV